MINEARFKPQVDTAVQKIKEILGLTRNPVLAENVPHEYEDKFGIAAWSTSLASIAFNKNVHFLVIFLKKQGPVNICF